MQNKCAGVLKVCSSGNGWKLFLSTNLFGALRETLISDEFALAYDATQQFAFLWSANNKSSIATSLKKLDRRVVSIINSTLMFFALHVVY